MKFVGRLGGRKGRRLASLACLCALLASGACQKIRDTVGGAGPRALADVPSARLAFRFEPDVDASALAAALEPAETEELHPAVKADFDTRRKDDALLRTILSPDGQRALALYGTAEAAENDFRIDLYSANGEFIRNIMPPELTGTLPRWAAWSPDGRHVAFIGIKNPSAQPSPTPPSAPPAADDIVPEAGASPAASVAPIIAPVPVFNTEQIYVCDRDGYQLRPLTTRDGLIYFGLSWSPDGSKIAALACTPAEWDARRSEDKEASGRPRLIELDGRERLLSDQIADSPPEWSPDGSKVAAAFDKNVTIYDAAGAQPTAANVPLEEPLRAASAAYDARQLEKEATDAPLSFNPVVRLRWLQPERLYVQTGFVRVYKTAPVARYLRWHLINLSPQAAVLASHAEHTYLARSPN